MMKREVVKIGVGLLLAACVAWEGRADEKIHLFAIGDAGSGTPMQRQVAEAMAAEAQQARVKSPVNFVVILGDNFYEAGVTSEKDPQWREKFEDMYDRNRLPMPFIAVLGNHDWRGDLPDVEIRYNQRNPGTRWQMDGHWFKRHFTAGDSATEKVDVDFFFLDSELWNPRDAHVVRYSDAEAGKKQMAWLTEELGKSKATWKLVAAHHPIFSNGWHGHDRDVLELRELLLPVLEKYKVDAYLSGHDHDLQRIQRPEAGTVFLISGAAGKLRTQLYREQKPFYAAKPGFLELELSASEMRGRFLDSQRNVLDEWTREPLSGAAGKLSRPSP